MLNIKTKSDTFQILGREEFSKRTNASNWEGCDHAKICTKSIFSNQVFTVLFRFMKSKDVTGSTDVKFWGKGQKKCNVFLFILFVI